MGGGYGRRVWAQGTGGGYGRRVWAERKGMTRQGHNSTGATTEPFLEDPLAYALQSSVDLVCFDDCEVIVFHKCGRSDPLNRMCGISSQSLRDSISKPFSMQEFPRLRGELHTIDELFMARALASVKTRSCAQA